MATQPDLGYGQRGDAPIDAFNQWLRARPEYQALLSSWGQSPNNVHLNDGQKQQVVRLAQSLGAKVDEGHNGQEVDDSGNFQAKSHLVRNIAIIGGIAAAALLTAGAAGAFAGPAAAGSSAAAGAGAAGAGTLAATATAPTVGALVAGGSGLAAAGGAGVAIPWATIIGAGSQLFGNLFAANQASNAADKGASEAAAAAKYSADLTAKANADAQRFNERSAENAYQNNEAARQGNYGIFAARERRLGSIGEEVGLGAREIPSYVPGVDPGFGTMGEAASGQPFAGAGGVGAMIGGGDILTALTNNYKALGVAPTGPGSGPTDIAYMAQRMRETGGLTPNNVSYWLGPQGRIAEELAKAKAGGGQTAQPVARTAAPATTATPFMPATLAPGPQAIGFYA